MSARTLLISFSSDWLYPPAGSEELATALRAVGKDVECHVIDAPYGHDWFLLEEARQTPMIQDFLAARDPRRRHDPRAAHRRDPRLRFRHAAIHAGQRPDPYTGARAVPIYQTTSYVFEDVDSAAAYFNLQEYGNTYSRIVNPTVAVLEERVASLEGGAGAVAFASGLAAQAATFFTVLQPGDHVVASQALYGGSLTQMKHLFRKLSVDLDLVDPSDLDAWRRAARPETKVFYGETIGNPAGTVLDLEAVAAIAGEVGAPLVVDNTFATPYLCRPLDHGADIVVHSATKFLGGHGTSIGGVVVDSGRFDWSNGRFPGVADPSPAYHGLAFHETFGVYGFLMKLRAETLRDLGAALSPFNAFLFLPGNRDAEPADRETRRERARRGRVPRVQARRSPRCAIRARPARRQVPAPRSRRRLLVRPRRAGARRARASSRRSRSGATSRTSAMRGAW